MSPKKKAPSNVVNGSPSKDLFIDMLTRDISLIDAISDLVDNCIDGAIRSRLQGSQGYDLKGFGVNIYLKNNSFKIKDNCGGIDKELAQKYAFRFGRTTETPSIKYSVGEFGIGMKRALFKIGNKFEIKSVSPKTKFTLEIDVNKWRKNPNQWDFKFKYCEDIKSKKSDCGTEITATLLNEDIKERFTHQNFMSGLSAKLELHHLTNIAKGLTIKINGCPVKSNVLKLIDANKFKTAFLKRNYPKQGNMNVFIYVGIGEDKLETGGWYIFCNNRLIIGPEQTNITSWGVRTPVRIPKYHSQFSRFRGFVFFEAKEPHVLPWNTSKNNVDIDSPVFQSVRLEMINLARPVIDFLNKVHDESRAYLNDKLSEKYLQNQIDSATLKNYLNVKKSSKFSAPVQKQKPKKTSEVKISYMRTNARVEKLREFFKVKSRKQVGEKTFDYTYDRECK